MQEEILWVKLKKYLVVTNDLTTTSYGPRSTPPPVPLNHPFPEFVIGLRQQKGKSRRRCSADGCATKTGSESAIG